MCFFPFLTARARWHGLAAVVLGAMSALFVAVGVRCVVAAFADDFRVLAWVGLGFGVAGLVGGAYAVRGWRSLARLRTERYGVRVDGDAVSWRAFDPWGDHEGTLDRRHITKATERPYRQRVHLHVELADGSNRWLPIWRLGVDDRAALYDLLGTPDAMRFGRRPAAPTPPVAAPAPAASVAVAVAVDTAPVRTVFATPTRNAPDAAVGASGWWAPARMLRTTAAVIEVLEAELGFRIPDTAARVGHGRFHFGHDEDQKGAPWLEVTTMGPWPPMGYEAGGVWADVVRLQDVRADDGRPFHLTVSSELRNEIGHCLDVHADHLDEWTCGRLATAIDARSRPDTPVRSSWRWLLAEDERDVP